MFEDKLDEERKRLAEKQKALKTGRWLIINIIMNRAINHPYKITDVFQMFES